MCVAMYNGIGIVKIIRIGKPHAAKILYENNVQRPSVRSTPNARWKWETLNSSAEGEDMVCARSKVRDIVSVGKKILGLIQEYAEVKTTSLNIEHYRKLGYECEDGYWMTVPVKDLTHGSGILIDVQCDYCKKIFKKQYRRYLETVGNITCSKCKSLKAQETHMERYGSKCVLWNKDVRDKIIEQSLERYGCENPGMSDHAREQRRQTCMDKYGAPTPLENPYILNDTRARNEESQGSVICSREQLKFNECIGGEPGVQVWLYCLDVVLRGEMICCEYDGGGHDLCVKMGRQTQADFDAKEARRAAYLHNLGYKTFRFINPRSRAYSEEDLLGALESARKHFAAGAYIYMYNHKTKTETIV